MADAITRLVVDCSVVVKWKIPTEDHAAAAKAFFVDWEHQVVDVSVPNHLSSNVFLSVTSLSSLKKASLPPQSHDTTL